MPAPDFYAQWDGATNNLIFRFPAAWHLIAGTVLYKLPGQPVASLAGTPVEDGVRLAIQLPTGRIPPGRPVDFYFELVDAENGNVRVPATGTIEMSFNDIT